MDFYGRNDALSILIRLKQALKNTGHRTSKGCNNSDSATRANVGEMLEVAEAPKGKETPKSAKKAFSGHYSREQLREEIYSLNKGDLLSLLALYDLRLLKKFCYESMSHILSKQHIPPPPPVVPPPPFGLYAKSKSEFACHVCKKYFATTSRLNAHMKTHNITRPYKCPNCDKSFVRKHHMRDHILSVHQKFRPFDCKYCSKSFSKKSTLLRHTKTHFQLQKPGVSLHRARGVRPRFPVDEELSAETETVGERFLLKESSFKNCVIQKEDTFCYHCGCQFPTNQLLMNHLFQGHQICARLRDGNETSEEL